MDLSQLANLGEFIGGVAVLVTLLYLSVQVRQNTNAARASADLEAAKLMADWHSHVSENPALADWWDEAAQESNELEGNELRVYLWFVAEYFFMAEGLYRQYCRGLLSDESWLPHTELLHSLVHNKVVNGWWQARMSPLSLDFRRYIEELDGTDYTLPIVVPDQSARGL